MYATEYVFLYAKQQYYGAFLILFPGVLLGDLDSSVQPGPREDYDRVFLRVQFCKNVIWMSSKIKYRRNSVMDQSATKPLLGFDLLLP